MYPELLALAFFDDDEKEAIQKAFQFLKDIPASRKQCIKLLYKKKMYDLLDIDNFPKHFIMAMTIARRFNARKYEHIHMPVSLYLNWAIDIVETYFKIRNGEDGFSKVDDPDEAVMKVEKNILSTLANAHTFYHTLYLKKYGKLPK
jgi:transposase